MSEDVKPREPRDYLTLGLLFSLVYIIFIAWLVYPKLAGLRDQELNAIGDFLAGVFGPMALMWLILGFLQQREELKQNTSALLLQVQELASSVEQQKELVQVNREMIAIELEQSEKSIQPFFMLAANRNTPPNAQLVSQYEITLRNEGSIATNVSVAFDKPASILAGRFFPNIKNDEPKSIYCHLQEQNFPIVLTLSYTDMTLKMQTRHFIMNAVEVEGGYRYTFQQQVTLQ